VDDIEQRILTLIDTIGEIDGQIEVLREEARVLRRDYLVKTAPERVCPNCLDYVVNEGETLTPCKGNKEW
jgi:hypothetical protein